MSKELEKIVKAIEMVKEDVSYTRKGSLTPFGEKNCQAQELLIKVAQSVVECEGVMPAKVPKVSDSTFKGAKRVLNNLLFLNDNDPCFELIFDGYLLEIKNMVIDEKDEVIDLCTIAMTKKCLNCKDKKVAEMVENCEGLVEKKPNTPSIESEEFHDGEQLLHMGYNEALDLFPGLMAKKCLKCREERTGQKPYDPERVKFLAGESKGDKT